MMVYGLITILELVLTLKPSVATIHLQIAKRNYVSQALIVLLELSQILLQWDAKSYAVIVAISEIQVRIFV